MADAYHERRWNSVFGSIRRGFFYNGVVYGIVTDGNGFGFYKVPLDVHGAAASCTYLDRAWVPSEKSNGVLAVCQFQGAIYLFFDSPTEYKRYRILYKKTTNPEGPWSISYDTGLTGTYGWDGKYGGAPSLSAVGTEERLFLFYSKDYWIWAATFDGSGWAHFGRPNNSLVDWASFAAHSACSVMIGGARYIVLGWVKTDRPNHLQLLFLTMAGGVARETEVYMDYAKGNDVFVIANGSTNATAQTNVLQIFANNSGTKNVLRRTAVNLDDWGVDPWGDTGIQSLTGGIFRTLFNWFDVVPAPVPVGTAGDFRQCLVLFTTDRPDMATAGQHVVSSYQSDYYRCDLHPKNSAVVSSGDLDTLIPKAWTLLGVIEGVPPFARNGNPPTRTATVEYKESTSETNVTKFRFQTSLVMSGSTPDAGFNVSAELEQTFAVAVETKRNVTGEYVIDFGNDRDDNVNGEKGILVVSRPRFRGGRYTRLSYDGTKEIAKYYVTLVDSVSVVPDFYDLENPRDGMLVRDKTSEFLKWRTPVPQFPKELVIDYPMNEITGSIKGGSSYSTLKFTTTQQRATSGSTSLKIEAAGVIEKLFKIKGVASFSLSYGSEVVYEFSQSATAKLTLPHATAPGTVEILHVEPHWLMPMTGARYRPGSVKPFWLPDADATTGILPWCLTWKVTFYQIKS